MEKTAIQEVYEKIYSGGTPIEMLVWLHDNETRLLSKTRNQIETSYNQGASDIDNLQDGNGRKFRNCMDYFTQTFGK